MTTGAFAATRMRSCDGRASAAISVAAVWVMQILLALAVGAAGTMKLVRSKTQLAAACLAVLMGGAVATHAIRREPAVVPTILALCAIIVATFR